MKTNRLVSHVRSHLVAYLALFLALGGTAIAADALKKNSVGTKQIKKNAVTNPKIKKNAVTGAKVKDQSLTGKDINESTLGAIPQAVQATTATNATTAQNANFWDGIDSAVLGTTEMYAGMEFEPRDSSGVNKIYISTGEIRCNGAPGDFTTRLELPQGAIVQSLQFAFVDNDGPANPSLNIVGYNILGLPGAGLSDTLVTASATGADPARRVVTVNAPPGTVINNDAFAYQLNWSPEDCDIASTLVGGAVNYTLPQG